MLDQPKGSRRKEGTGQMEKGLKGQVSQHLRYYFCVSFFGLPLRPNHRKITHLCDLTKGSAFLAEVDDNTTATILCFLHGFLNTKDEIWSAGADIGAKDIAAIALKIMSAK